MIVYSFHSDVVFIKIIQHITSEITYPHKVAIAAPSIPIIGMGGLMNAEDVIEMMLAGATAVEVGTANLIDPFACKRIVEELPAVMEKYKINNLSEIIGGAH